MAHTERLEPDLFAGILELSLNASSQEAHRQSKTKLHDEDGDKSEDAFKTISETARMLSLPQHVLRFWESKFSQIKPLKLKGGRRYYRPQDIEVLLTIKHLLYKQGYTIKGARKAFGQLKRHKEPVMAQAIPPKKRKEPRIEDTPLFSSLMGAPQNAPQSALVQAALHPVPQMTMSKPAAPAPDARKKELQAIHGELLELRELIKNLPPLTTPN